MDLHIDRPMDSSQIEIIIPIAESDLDSLLFSMPYIKNYLTWKKIVIIADKKVEHKLCGVKDISFIDENDLIDGMTFSKVRSIISKIYPKAIRRTGWYFQQFLKLAYAYKCKSEYYLTWDSDTIPLKKIDFFDESGEPYLDYVPAPFGDNDYFALLKKFPDHFSHKEDKRSFITEHMLFNAEIVKEMIDEINQSSNLIGETFYERILRAIDKKCLNLSGFSEFETYAAFVQNTANLYHLRRWKNLRNGKFYLGSAPSAKQLQWVGKDFDVASIEDYDSYMFLNRLIGGSFCFRQRIKFKSYYNIINPFYKGYYDLRLILRTLIKR